MNVAECRDYSSTGVRLASERLASVGEEVAVCFAADTLLMGRVAWVNGYECGVQFGEPVDKLDKPLPPIRVLSPLTGTERRFRDGLPVKLVAEGREREATLRWTKDEYASLLVDDSGAQ